MRDRKLLNIELGRISAGEFKNLPPSGVAVVLDNIRSAHNVGSVLRTADAFKVDKVLLCGISPIPPTPEIHKVALGAEQSMPWEHVDDTLALVRRLRAEGWTVVCAEQTEHALSLQDFRREPGRRYALVFGNEVDGVRQDVVDEADLCVEIPQYGTKHSLNVSVSVGIVLWQLVRPA